ncbi:hypothetical protein [Mycobacterium sp. 050134]
MSSRAWTAAFADSATPVLAVECGNGTKPAGKPRQFMRAAGDRLSPK